jgi:hypothetical protein
MDISKVNDLLGQVRLKLESLEPGSAEEGIETMSTASGGSVSAANGRLAHLMAKLGANRSDANKVKAAGAGKRK